MDPVHPMIDVNAPLRMPLHLRRWWP